MRQILCSSGAHVLLDFAFLSLSRTLCSPRKTGFLANLKALLPTPRRCILEFRVGSCPLVCTKPDAFDAVCSWLARSVPHFAPPFPGAGASMPRCFACLSSAPFGSVDALCLSSASVLADGSGAISPTDTPDSSFLSLAISSSAPSARAPCRPAASSCSVRAQYPATATCLFRWAASLFPFLHSLPAHIVGFLNPVDGPGYGSPLRGPRICRPLLLVDGKSWGPTSGMMCVVVSPNLTVFRTFCRAGDPIAAISRVV